jgi:hypothetical protein
LVILPITLNYWFLLTFFLRRKNNLDLIFWESFLLKIAKKITLAAVDPVTALGLGTAVALALDWVAAEHALFALSFPFQ